MIKNIKAFFASWCARRDALRYIKERESDILQMRTIIDALSVALQDLDANNDKGNFQNDILALTEMQQSNDRRMNRLQQLKSAVDDYDAPRIQALIGPYTHEDHAFLSSVGPNMQNVLDHLAQFGTKTVGEHGECMIRINTSLNQSQQQINHLNKIMTQPDKTKET